MASPKKLAEQANAVHEAGHAVSLWIEPMMLGAKRVTIVEDPERGSLGSTEPKVKRWLRSLTSRRLLRAKIRFYFAGRVAEELCLGEPFVGSSDDLENATGLAMLLVACEGMNGGVGKLCLGQMAGSEHVKKLIDIAVAGVLDECYREEKKRLSRKKQEILKVAFSLIKHKTLKRRHLKKILGKRPKLHIPFGELKRRPERKNARRK